MRFIAVLFLSLLFGQAFGQCIVINEVMINAPGGQANNDGSNVPNTAEWVEFYNTCNTVQDLSCYVFSDGDFTFTFPQNSSIAPNGYFVIGSVNSGVTLDVSWATCGCTSVPSEVGVFTNGAGQMMLTNGSGVLQDAMYYGSGDFPVNITAPAINGCSSTAFNYNNNSLFEQAPAGSDGCTTGRTCDGGSTWAEFCGTATPGANNSGNLVTPDFSASDLEICTGQCIDFTDESSGNNMVQFDWNFEVTTVSSPTSVDPAGICYPNAGYFDVTLAITVQGCGVYTAFMADYIHVTDLVAAHTADGPLAICASGDVIFETTNTGTYQWNLGGAPIPGETGSTYTATAAGSYTVTVTNGGCSDTSDPSVVTITSGPTVIIDPAGPVSLCAGTSTTLSSTTIFDSYQWREGGTNIPGETAQTLEVDAAGFYSLEVTDDGCAGVSPNVQVMIVTVPAPLINEGSLIQVCNDNEVPLTSQQGFDSYQWKRDGNDIPGATTYTYIATESGDYTVVVTNVNDCEGTSAITVVEMLDLAPPVISSSTGSFVFCEDDPITISVPAIYDNYDWLLNGIPNGVSTSQLTPINGNYSVTVYLDFCSSTSNSLAVTAVPLPTAIIDPSDDLTICATSYAISATSDASIQWQFNGVDIPGATAPVYVADADGDYRFIATNATNCSSLSDEITLTLISHVDVDIISSGNNLCVGQSVTLSVVDVFDTILWSTGASTPSTLATSTDDYTIEVNLGGCIGRDTVSLVFSEAALAYAGEDLTTFCEGDITLTGTGIGSIAWLPSSSILYSDSATAVVSPKLTTTYILQAINGTCVDQDDITVTTDCSSLFVPSAFTPDNDGINDVFRVYARGVSTYHFIIYNRWGDVVFESTDPEDVWTGGKGEYFVPDGVYTWSLFALDMSKLPFLGEDERRGLITVIR